MTNKFKLYITSLCLFLSSPLLIWAQEEDSLSVSNKVDKVFENLVAKVAPVLFAPVQLPGWDAAIPLIVFFLCIGALTFTFLFRFVNVRLFKHAIDCIRGKFDDPHDHGEISHFQALTSALSATVGLGNIAGVAVAITLGGPGAVFWMWCIAFFGMSSKFTSCTLAQLYRRVTTHNNEDRVLGGPMIYLEEGIAETIDKGGSPGFGKHFGKLLGVLFALFAITGSIGGGNMFQGNQTFKIVSEVMNVPSKFDWLGGLIMAFFVGLVILGGIKRIGKITSKMIPFMCGFYVIVCLIIILSNIAEVGPMLKSIVAGAFQKESVFGGFIGVFVQGAKRAAFSNEAGLGSAAIAHSAARTHEPVREGLVAMVGPFIDTILVCTMTALTILITKSHLDVTGAPQSIGGVEVTMAAFTSLSPGLKYALMLAVIVFAYSTMISWSYYGEKASEYLFGPKAIVPYRVLFLFFVILGPMLSLNNLIDFTDLMILSMAYPNILGMIILAPKVNKLLIDYSARLKSGEIKPYK